MDILRSIRSILAPSRRIAPHPTRTGLFPGPRRPSQKRGVRKQNHPPEDDEDKWTLPRGEMIFYPIIPLFSTGQKTLLAVQHVKRGTFDGDPATLIVLTVRHRDYSARHGASFFFTVKGKEEGSDASFLACAPGAVALPLKKDQRKAAARVELKIDTTCVEVKVCNARRRQTGIPYRFRIALLIAHRTPGEGLQLQVGYSRYWSPPKIFRQPTSLTLDIPSTIPSNTGLVTCARWLGTPCHADCANFAKNHTTPDAWKALLVSPRDLERYQVFEASQGFGGWVRYLSGI